jgi:MFS family permease
MPHHPWIPDGDRSQQAIIALVAIARVTTGGIVGTAMAVYIGRRGNPFAVSMAWTVFSLGLMICSPVWGAIADITGRRRPILIATALLAGGSLLPLTISQGVWAQIGIRGLYAVFAAGYRTTLLTIVSEQGGAETRGHSFGIYNSARSVGGIGRRVLAGFLLGVLAPSDLYLYVSVGTLLAATGTILILDPTPTPRGRVTGPALVREIRRRLFPAVDEREHLRRNGLQWLYVGLALRNTAWKGVVSVAPVFLVSNVGVSEFVMGLVLAISPTFRMFFMYLFGRASDAIGRKPLITAGLAGSVLPVVLLTAALLPAATAYRAVVAGSAYFAHALVFSALAIGSVAFIGDTASTDRESELMGLRSTARSIGGVIGPIIVGSVATVASYPVAFLGTSTLAIVATGLVALKVEESHEGVRSLRRIASGGD